MQQVVSDEKSGPILVQPLQRFHHGHFVFSVQRRRRLIEEEDGRPANGGAGNRNALPLALRKRHAPFAKNRIVSLRQGLDKLVGVGQLSRGLNVFQSGRHRAISDVVLHTGREEKIVL